MTQILTDIFGNLDSTDLVVLLKVINKAKAKAKQKAKQKQCKHGIITQQVQVIFLKVRLYCKQN